MAVFRCSNCGYESDHADQVCPKCVSYDSMYEVGAVTPAKEPAKRPRPKGLEVWSLILAVNALIGALGCLCFALTGIGALPAAFACALNGILIAVSRELQAKAVKKLKHQSGATKVANVISIIAIVLTVVVILLYLLLLFGCTFLYGNSVNQT